MFELLEHTLLGPVRASAAATIRCSGWTPDGPGRWCDRCGASVPQHEVQPILDGCPRCAIRGRSGRSAGRRIDAGHQPRLGDEVVRLGRYESPLSDWIVAIKHGGWAEMGGALGGLLGAAVGSALTRAGLQRAPRIVVAVPTPMLRRLHRGIDHAACIAVAVGEALDAPVVPLLKRRSGPTQASRSARARRAAGANGILLANSNPMARAAEIGGARRRWIDWGLDRHVVVLVDDVRTTGTTLSRCVRVIRTLSPRWVVVAAIASADDDRSRSSGLHTRSIGQLLRK